MFTIIPPDSGSLQISRLNHPGVQARNLELFPFFSLAFTNRVTEVNRESPREGTGDGEHMPETLRAQSPSGTLPTSEVSSSPSSHR